MPTVTIDYSIFYKKKFLTTDQLKADSNYDFFISAYNDSKRVKEVFNEVNAVNKHWILFPEYRYKKSEEPPLNTTDGI